MILALTLMCFALAAPMAAGKDPGPSLTFDRYHKPEETAAALQDLARANPGFAKAHVLAKSPGGRDLVLLEVGPETAKTGRTLPAVFVAADMDGTVPLSAEAALWLAQTLCGKSDLRADRTWYILACGNPDAAARYFGKPLYRDTRNGRPMNDDQDDATDEDGPDDLDGPGGVSLGTAFPHLFKYHAPDAGPWPASETETYALLKFFDAHREIGLAF